MERVRIPKPGEIYQHFKDKPYQIITVATHSETGEKMVVYQALYGDFKTYVRPLDMFISEVDHLKYPEVTQKYRFELRKAQDEEIQQSDAINSFVTEIKQEPVSEDAVNSILMKFLDAPSYTKKMDVVSSNIKHLNDRLVNDMAVALDCTIDEGPMEQRIKELLYCLQAMCRFEDRRLR
jgi:Uncharacterized protein conserved in bacteria